MMVYQIGPAGFVVVPDEPVAGVMIASFKNGEPGGSAYVPDTLKWTEVL